MLLVYGEWEERLLTYNFVFTELSKRNYLVGIPAFIMYLKLLIYVNSW